MPSQVSLSFDKGKGSTCIATVVGGDYDKEELHLHDGTVEKGSKRGVRELELGKHRLSMLPPRKQSEVMRLLQQAYAQGIPPEHLNLASVPGAEDAYREMLGEMESKGDKYVKLPPNSTFALHPCRQEDKREIWYIAGASGSGKSHIAKRLAEQYQKQFPDRPVYLVSKLAEDATLDSMKKPPIRLNVDKLVEEPMKDLEPLRDSMILFDDYDTFTKPHDAVVQKLIDDIATMGRHTNTTMLCMTHYLSNYKKTRLMLTEATHFVVYPQSTGAHALNYLLKTYLGLAPKEVADMRKTGSRWVCIHKNYPQHCITENCAWLLNQAEE